MENTQFILFIALLTIVLIGVGFIVFKHIKLLEKCISRERQTRPITPDPRPRPTDEFVTHKVKLELVSRPWEDQKWLLVNLGRNDEPIGSGPLRVGRGDTIIWNSPVPTHFQFPLADLFNGVPKYEPWTPKAERKEDGTYELELIVNDRAEPGVYVYCVFCNPEEGQEGPADYAEGKCPPEVIIM